MDAEKNQNVVPVSQDNKMSETEKALFKRMKGVMKKEVEQVPAAATRRGFLHTLLAGGVVAAGGVAGVAIVGSPATLEAANCSQGFACAEGFTCSSSAVTCPLGFACASNFNSDPPPPPQPCPDWLT